MRRMAPTPPPDGQHTIVTNRKARHEYEILETIEAGIALIGPEVKSMREGRVHLTDAYASVEKGEMILRNVHVSPYEKARDNAEPTRARKLLLHRKQILRLQEKIEQAGLTLIPLRMYFRRGLVKVELGIGRGKKAHDKRQTMATRDAKREIDRAVRDRQRGGNM